jgi:hypothetical protein
LLSKLEEALKAALEAPFARFFPEQIHPLELAGQLRQTMAAAQLITAEGSFVPNRYTVSVSLPDYRSLEQVIPNVERELGAHLLQYCQAEGLLCGPQVHVIIAPEDRFNRGKFTAAGEWAARPEANLTVEGGFAAVGRKYPLGEKTLLGRGDDSDIVIPEAAVSRHHAEIVWSYVQYRLRDLGSANGSFVNSQQVSQALLHDGDLVEIGFVQLRFHLS